MWQFETDLFLDGRSKISNFHPDVQNKQFNVPTLIWRWFIANVYYDIEMLKYFFQLAQNCGFGVFSNPYRMIKAPLKAKTPPHPTPATSLLPTYLYLYKYIALCFRSKFLMFWSCILTWVTKHRKRFFLSERVFFYFRDFKNSKKNLPRLRLIL